MKNLILFVISILLNGTFALAQDSRSEVIENSVVKSTYELMQSKNNGTCDELNVNSVQFMCMGAIPSNITKLQLITSGCGIAVEIKCPTGSARIFGQTKSVSAIDSSGIRQDIKGINLGLTFSSITITPVVDSTQRTCGPGNVMREGMCFNDKTNK